MNINIVDLFVENWAFIVIGLYLLIVGGYYIYYFSGLPTSVQKEKILQWLLFATIEAEKTFGNQTGAIKLRYVYDKFIKEFPTVSKIISFDTFSKLVDEALEQMKHLLETNTAIQNYVVGKE